MPLPLLAVGQGFIGSLTSVFRFGHAKAVANENSAIGAAQNQVTKELGKLETLASEGRLSDAEIDSRLQVILDSYFSTVASVIKGRIESEDDFNTSTKKTKSGGPCNAACVIGGQVADVIEEARDKLKKLAKQGRGKTGGPVSQAGVLSPLAGVLKRLPLWTLFLIPGGLLLSFLVYFIWKRGK